MQALLGDRARRRDLLIEHLHLLQDHYGCLHARHLAALAEEMRLALVEVYEVASFYAHFDIVHGRRGAAAAAHRAGLRQPHLRAGRRARSCSASCATRLGDGVRVVRAPCMGGCHNAPVAAIGHALHEHATVDSVAEAVARRRHASRTSRRIVDLDAYRADGGYKLLEACLAGARPLESVIEAAGGLGAARPRRRRLPDRAQMALRARRAGAAR